MGFPQTEPVVKVPEPEAEVVTNESIIDMTETVITDNLINTPKNIAVEETTIEKEETTIESAELQQKFKPQINNQNNIIVSIAPAKFDGLLKVLGLLIDSNDPIIIENSTITKNLKSGAIISMDVKDVFKDNTSLHIVNPRKNIKLFKTLNNNNDIYITEDPDNSRYIVMNGEVRLFLPKQDDSISEYETVMPSLTGVKNLSNFMIDKDTKQIIKELSRDADYIEFLFQDSVMKAIHIPDTAIYIFEKYINDKEASKLDETNAELALRSTSFLPIAADNYELNIGQLKDDSYCSYTICDTGYIKVNVFEELENTTGGSIF